MNKRKELYAAIVKHNLQEEVKKKYGRNYTQVGSAQLEEIINLHTKNDKKKTSSKPEVKEPSKKVPTSIPVSTSTSSSESKVDRLIKVLAGKRILLKSEVEFINKED